MSQNSTEQHTNNNEGESGGRKNADIQVIHRCDGKRILRQSATRTHLRLREIDEIALVLGEILRGSLLLLALILEDLDLVFAAEIVAAAAAAHVWHYCEHASDDRRPLFSLVVTSVQLSYLDEIRMRFRCVLRVCRPHDEEKGTESRREFQLSPTARALR